MANNPIVTITMQDGGVIKAELYPETAPMSVRNFISLINGGYAAFGKVTEGMDVVNRIAETATDYSDRPLEDQVMKSVTVETFGVEYPEPEHC
ncbi:MAG: peptidylprolyl isomerase [Clostridium sp.]|nr:peptidylprolyl isomerase [Bacteroides sp.]MCM1563674.1 peptidylprolyl isomerase [Clostridium sp.]